MKGVSHTGPQETCLENTSTCINPCFWTTCSNQTLSTSVRIDLILIITILGNLQWRHEFVCTIPWRLRERTVSPHTKLGWQERQETWPAEEAHGNCKDSSNKKLRLFVCLHVNPWHREFIFKLNSYGPCYGQFAILVLSTESQLITLLHAFSESRNGRKRQ
jgi:hypothetical protein